MSGEDEIAAQVEEARRAAEGDLKTKSKTRKRRPRNFPFKVYQGQVFRQIETEGKDGEARKKWVPFVSELNVCALTRSAEGEDWGRLLEVVDRDGERHEWAMPLAILAGDGRDLRAELLRLGLEPVPGAGRRWKEWLGEYLFGAEPEARARCVNGIGWHNSVFVLPDETIGGDGKGDRVILQSAARLDHAFDVAGDLSSWKKNVARIAEGNSRLILAISAAFASPLLALTGEDGGGFHLRGGSSVGKSTALFAAASVWGGGGVRGYVRNWRATDNALEALAELHDGALLCLDELSQVEPRAAGAAAYMLANGKGKARAGREGQARRAHEWRLIFLSTGEITLSDKIKEGGGQIAAGMEVRVIDLRADAGAGLGIFECIHDSADAAAFAQELKSAAERNYGAPARAFLAAVVSDLDNMKEGLEKLRRGFVKKALPAVPDGQVRRVADRFALAAAAGEIATNLGITGWPQGASIEATLKCFQDWLEERGGSGASETAEAKRRLADALETYGAARFQKWHTNSDRAVITPRWGFQKVHDEDGNALKVFEWYFTASAMGEVLAGLDRRAIIAALVAEGVIVTYGAKAEPNKVHHVPNGGGKMRLYQINPTLLSTASSGANGAE